MKIRNGFVSNSSSSSFIVFWPHEPKDENDVFEMMFGNSDKDEIIDPYDYAPMTLEEIASIVYRDTTRDACEMLGFENRTLEDCAVEAMSHYFYLVLDNTVVDDAVSGTPCLKGILQTEEFRKKIEEVEKVRPKKRYLGKPEELEYYNALDKTSDELAKIAVPRRTYRNSTITGKTQIGEKDGQQRL